MMTTQIAQPIFATQANTPDLNSDLFREIDVETNALALEEIRRLNDEELALQKRHGEIYQNRNAIRAAVDNRSAEGVRDAVQKSRTAADAFAPLRVIRKDMLQAANAAINLAGQIPGALGKLDEIKKQYPDEASVHDPFARKVRMLREDAAAFAANHSSCEQRFNAALTALREEHLAEFDAARKRYEDFTTAADELEAEFSEKYSETSQRIEAALKSIKTPGGKR